MYVQMSGCLLSLHRCLLPSLSLSASPCRDRYAKTKESLIASRTSSTRRSNRIVFQRPLLGCIYTRTFRHLPSSSFPFSVESPPEAAQGISSASVQFEVLSRPTLSFSWNTIIAFSTSLARFFFFFSSPCLSPSLLQKLVSASLMSLSSLLLSPLVPSSVTDKYNRAGGLKIHRVGGSF